MNLEDNRVGMIRFDIDIFSRNPLESTKILSHIEFFPFSSHINFWDKYFEMQGYSPNFRQIEDGEAIPGYEIHVYMAPDGTPFFEKITEVTNEKRNP